MQGDGQRFEGAPAGLVGSLADRHFLFNPRLSPLEMSYRLFYFSALGLRSGVAIVSAQPGPITTSNNSNLVFAASTLLTNGLPGLSGPPVTLMVATVQSNSAQGGVVSLVTSQPWVRRYNGAANNEDQAFAVIADKDGNIIVGGSSYVIGSGVDYLTIKYNPD